jgi:hypothetical protein
MTEMPNEPRKLNCTSDLWCTTDRSNTALIYPNIISWKNKYLPIYLGVFESSPSGLSRIGYIYDSGVQKLALVKPLGRHRPIILVMGCT